MSRPQKRVCTESAVLNKLKQISHASYTRQACLQSIHRSKSVIDDNASFLLASILKFVFIMMHLNHCIILFFEERIWRIEVSKILSLNLELFGIDVKGLVGSSCGI